MKPEDLAYFICPECHSANLRISAERLVAGEVQDGQILCSGCRKAYIVKNSVPRFVSQENYASSFGLQWTIHEKTQLDSQIGRHISRQRLFHVTGWSEDLAGQCVLEAGSGAGRFTEILLQTGAQVFSFDYSAAVEANQRNNGASQRLRLFQGDLRKIPLPRGTFDKVLCLGVLQHTPSPAAAFECLCEMVRPDGELVVDVYRKDLRAMMQWKYALRPVTKRMNQATLYRLVSRVVPAFLPFARVLRKIAGRVGARLLPIVEYSHLGLSPDQNNQWATLDTFDMYAPAYDFPQTRDTLERWYRDAGFVNVTIADGPNGLVGKGKRGEGIAQTNSTGVARLKCAESSV